MALVAGVDSSTQSCKVVVRDAGTGALVREGTARHPDGTEVDPEAWWTALWQAVEAAGGLDDVEALAVGGQQHGLVALDADGAVVRPALLWNDTRSGDAAAALVDELGAQAWADAVGTVPVASLTVTKLRWLADHEPEHARRLAAVCLPHDWLTWRLRGSGDLTDLVTDRSDASGTGYFDAAADDGAGAYRRDLLARALRRDEADVADLVLPRALGPGESGGPGSDALGLGHLVLGPGCGDNAGSALALGLVPGTALVSLGTSGVVSVAADRPFADASGQVAGFADAAGGYLGLAVTLNAARVLDAAATVLGVDHAGLSDLALAAEPGAGGLVQVPYLDGERTPNLPEATGSLLGLTTTALTRENYARAAVEGLWCLMADALDAVADLGVDVDRVLVIGGAARSPAVRAVGAHVLGRGLGLPATGEHVADGAARQAAWVLAGGEAPPAWEARDGDDAVAAPDDPAAGERVRAAYAAARQRLHPGVGPTSRG